MTKRTHGIRISRNPWSVWVGLVVILILGCDDTDQLVRPQSAGPQRQILTGSQVSPRAVIEECVSSYKRLKSYEDAAHVRLSYRLDGESMVDQAPLAVGWDGSGKIGLKVYSVVAGPDGSRWRLKIDEEALAKQTLSREVPRKLDFGWLLSDPIVADRLAAGLAGFPPQLDLLLSPHPLSRLIDETAELAFDFEESIDDRLCYVIAVKRGTLQYRLWIDKASMLLRRIQIPNENLAPQILADKRVRDLQLTIELDHISTNHTVNWTRFAVSPTVDDVLVNHFVPPPQLIDTAGIGARIPAFTMESPDGQIAFNSASEPAKKACVLVWLADHPACRVAAEQIANTRQQLLDAGLSPDDIQFVSVWAEPNPPQGTSFESLSESWKLPGTLVVDRQALGRDLFGVQEAPTLIVLDGNNRLQLRETRANPILDQVLPQLLMQIADGVDLAGDMLNRNSSLLVRHQVELSMAVSVDGTPQPLPDAYSPTLCKLIEVARNSQDSTRIAAAADDQGMLWTLSSSGKVEKIETSGAVASSFVTTWKPTEYESSRRQASMQLSASPDGDFLALKDANASILHVFDTRKQRATSLDLGQNVRAMDAQWLHVDGVPAPRLAVITSDARTVLLDPTNHEQLSGRCPADPLAILPYDQPGSSVGGLVILADGAVEPLELSGDSAAKRVTGKQVSLKDTAEGYQKKLGFLPGLGPWQSWSSDQETQRILARGWIAADEPALFMLDESLSPYWHYRIPLSSTSSGLRTSTAVDPNAGQPVWAIADSTNTIFLLRADGVGSDHFRVAEDVIGLSLIADGKDLKLRLVHPQTTVTYNVTWPL